MQNKLTFTAKDGASISFTDHIAFSVWFFSISRRVMVAAFDAVTFKRMEYLATKSAAARRRMY